MSTGNFDDGINPYHKILVKKISNACIDDDEEFIKIFRLLTSFFPTPDAVKSIPNEKVRSSIAGIHRVSFYHNSVHALMRQMWEDHKEVCTECREAEEEEEAEEIR